MITLMRTLGTLFFTVCIVSATAYGQHSDVPGDVPSGSGKTPQPSQMLQTGHSIFHLTRVPSLDALSASAGSAEPSQSQQFKLPQIRRFPINQLPEPAFVVRDGAVYIAIPALGPVTYIPMVGGGASGCIPKGSSTSSNSATGPKQLQK